MSEQVVHHHPPAGETASVHLEEVGVKQQLQAFFAPCLARVLVPTHTAQKLRAGSEAWHIVCAAGMKE